MDSLLAILIVCLSALGLGAGLLMGRGAPRKACDGLACAGGTRCDGCPHTSEQEST